MFRFFSLAALFLSVQSQGYPCDLLKQLYPEDASSEQELLSQFSPAKIISAAESPTGSAVTIVELEGGVKYVVRQPGALDHLDFERFASELIRRAPGGNTPLVRTLGKQETKVALERMRAANPDLSFGNVDPEELNVAMFYPMQRGKEYLKSESSNVMLSFARNALLAFAINGNPSHREEFKKQWSRLYPASKQTLVDELRVLSPELSTLTAENAGMKIPELMEKTAGAFAPLMQKEIEGVPAEVRRQLADHWILYTLLGIPDFHNNNWLIHHDVVLAIDVALKSRDFVIGTHTTRFAGQEMPLSWLVGAEVPGQKLLVSWASPEMVNYLRDLNGERVKDAATAAGYKLSEDNLSGVLARAKKILKLRN